MKRILIIDDHADVRRLLRWSLEDLGQRVALHEAHNGTAGVQLAMEHAPDLVLLDVMMPGCDGLEACRRLRAEPKLAHTRVVLVSARGQAADVQAGLDAGASAYVVKPFSPNELLATVEKLLLA